jgi:hypothetical protein
MKTTDMIIKALRARLQTYDDRRLFVLMLEQQGFEFSEENKSIILNGPRLSSIVRLSARIRNEIGMV